MGHVSGLVGPGACDPAPPPTPPSAFAVYWAACRRAALVWKRPRCRWRIPRSAQLADESEPTRDSLLDVLGAGMSGADTAFSQRTGAIFDMVAATMQAGPVGVIPGPCGGRLTGSTHQLDVSRLWHARVLDAIADGVSGGSGATGSDSRPRQPVDCRPRGSLISRQSGEPGPCQSTPAGEGPVVLAGRVKTARAQIGRFDRILCMALREFES